MILRQSALAVLLISYHPLKGVKFTLKLLIMIFFYKYNTKQHKTYLNMNKTLWERTFGRGCS